MPCTCRTRARTRPPRPAPTMVIGVVMCSSETRWIATPMTLARVWSGDPYGRMELMATKSQRAPRRREALSRDVIVQTAAEILDAGGEGALTLWALTVRLATGYGAIYHHVADRNDLLAAAADHIIAHIVTGLADAEPQQALRAFAVGLFDAISAHPWVGAQLNRELWRPALLDLYESLSEQLQALGVPQQALSDS